MSDYEPLTSTVRPKNRAIITVRVIKSFEYRTIKNHVYTDIDLTKTTVAELLEMVKQTIKSQSGFKAYRTVSFDTVKIYTQAHGSKSMNLVINMEHDEDWILDSASDKTLEQCGVENETELSVFNREAYEAYKKNPEEKW